MFTLDIVQKKLGNQKKPDFNSNHKNGNDYFKDGSKICCILINKELDVKPFVPYLSRLCQ